MDANQDIPSEEPANTEPQAKESQEETHNTPAGERQDEIRWVGACSTAAEWDELLKIFFLELHACAAILHEDPGLYGLRAIRLVNELVKRGMDYRSEITLKTSGGQEQKLHFI